MVVLFLRINTCLFYCYQNGALISDNEKTALIKKIISAKLFNIYNQEIIYHTYLCLGALLIDRYFENKFLYICDEKSLETNVWGFVDMVTVVEWLNTSSALHQMDWLIAINRLRSKTSRVDFNQQNPVDGTQFARPCINGTDLVGCVSSLETSRASVGRHPQALTLLEGVRFIAPLFWGMPTGPEAFLGYRACLGYVWTWTHLKKALSNTCPVGGAVNKYHLFDKLDPVYGAHFGRPCYLQHESGRVC